VNRIVCIGNRYVPADGAGPAVYDRLEKKNLPPGIDLIDGGIGGLNLLGALDGAETVVFVDATRGLGPPGGVRVFDAGDIALTADECFGHGAGLPYLLRMIPVGLAVPPSRVYIVGLETPADENSVGRAAETVLRLAGGAGP